MRLSDIITPNDLCKIFLVEKRALLQLGRRDDLIDAYIKKLSDRLSTEYYRELQVHIGESAQALGAFRMLCLIDKLLEEKYGHTNTSAD